MRLLDEIERYLDKTGMSAKSFGILSKCGRSFVYELRYRRLPGDEVSERARAYMAAYPPKRDRSKEKSDYKAPFPGFNRQPPRIDDSSLVRVDRTPCYNCGVRGDIGCEHFPLDYSKRRFENILDSAFLRITNKTARSSSAKVETGLVVNRQLGGNK